MLAVAVEPILLGDDMNRNGCEVDSGRAVSVESEPWAIMATPCDLAVDFVGFNLGRSSPTILYAPKDPASPPKLSPDVIVW